MRTTIVGIVAGVALLTVTANAHAGPIGVSLYQPSGGVTLSEPASLLLVGTGVAALVRRRLRSTNTRA